MHCRGHAPPLRIRRSVASPFATLAWSALPWAFRREALTTALACTLLILAGSLLGAGFIFRCAALGYLFEITRSTAAGHDQVPLPSDFEGLFADVIGPALRLFVSVIWIWGALTLPSYLPALGGAWFSLLLFCAAALYVPVALLVAAARARILEVANPALVLSCGLRLGSDWLRLCAFCAATFAAQAAVRAVEARLGGEAVFGLVGVNLLVAAPGTLLLTLLAMATFRAAGLLLRVRGDDVGYGAPGHYLEPVLGATAPRGVLPPGPAP